MTTTASSDPLGVKEALPAPPSTTTANANATDFAAGSSNLTTTITTPTEPKAVPLSPEGVRISDWYQDHGLEFEHLDDEATARKADQQVRDPNCKNLVIDFGEKHAWVGMNIQGEEGAKKLVNTGRDKRPGGMQTRWIAIFSPHKQEAFVKAIVSPYGLSTRHKHLILSAPGEGNLEIAQKVWHWQTVDHGERFLSIGYNSLHHVLSKKALRRARTTETVPGRHGTTTSTQPGPGAQHGSLGAKFASMFRRRKAEKDTIIPMTNDPHHPNGRTPTFSTGASEHTGHDDRASIKDLGETQKIIRKTYRPKSRHFHRHRSSSDVSDTEGDEDSSDSEDESHFVFDIPNELSDVHYHPKMLRLWHWLIITDDGTIITIHEPIPALKNVLGGHPEVQDVHGHVRRNLRNILRCLSNAKVPEKDKSRVGAVVQGLESGALEVRKRPEIASQLLYYYLFEDWYSTWSLAVDRAHPYSKVLADIRESHPEMHHIDDLHDTIQRLGSLRLVYQSYQTIITSVLQKSAKMTPTDKGIKFNIHAVTRFQRLKERIENLAMTEIDNCQKEGEGLVSLTYNRLNFIETKSVEKLTLLTVALAKVTIVFLPLSLITAFFSMQVDGITNRWNSNVFWASIGIALGLTLLFLLFISGVDEAVRGIRASWTAAKKWNTAERKQERKEKRKKALKARQREATRGKRWMN